MDNYEKKDYINYVWNILDSLVKIYMKMYFASELSYYRYEFLNRIRKIIDKIDLKKEVFEYKRSIYLELLYKLQIIYNKTPAKLLIIILLRLLLEDLFRLQQHRILQLRHHLKL